MSEGITIEQFVEDMKKQIGNTFGAKEIGEIFGPRYPKPWVYMNTEITRDFIRHFADAIGDINPIYRDAEYAKKTKYGCLIAPPTILYCICYGTLPWSMPDGMLTLYGGDEVEFFKPLCEGDQITWRTVFPTSLELKSSKYAKKLAIVYGRNEYIRGDGELLARCTFWTLWNEVGSAKEQDAYTGRTKKPVYTKEYIKEVYATQDREVVRGANTRYWEDVQVGEELPPVVRGPYTAAETIAWSGVLGVFFMCSDRLLRIIGEKMPAWLASYDPDLKIKVNLELAHFDNNTARKMGSPRAFDFASQRASWIDMVLTNWVGDEGHIWKLRTECRTFLFQGDVGWCKAKVTRKYIDEGKCCVDVDCWCENQLGEMTMPGKATLILPSRQHGPIVYPKP